jgi:hypothetical protein
MAFQLSLLGRASLAIACCQLRQYRLFWTQLDVIPTFSLADLDVEWRSQLEREMWTMSIFSKSSLCPNCAGTAHQSFLREPPNPDPEIGAITAT